MRSLNLKVLYIAVLDDMQKQACMHCHARVKGHAYGLMILIQITPGSRTSSLG